MILAVFNITDNSLNVLFLRLTAIAVFIHFVHLLLLSVDLILLCFKHTAFIHLTVEVPYVSLYNC
jgi:hypothetical protein